MSSPHLKVCQRSSVLGKVPGFSVVQEESRTLCKETQAPEGSEKGWEESSGKMDHEEKHRTVTE